MTLQVAEFILTERPAVARLHEGGLGTRYKGHTEPMV